MIWVLDFLFQVYLVPLFQPGYLDTCWAGALNIFTSRNNRYQTDMKKFIGSVIPFLLFHLFCCGALLIFLTTSGYLLLIRNEGRNKTFLIPILLLGGLFFFLHWYFGKCCEKKDHKTFGDHTILIILYIAFSFLLGIAFMIYVFIPWWIPNYTGGFLLP